MPEKKWIEGPLDLRPWQDNATGMFQDPEHAQWRFAKGARQRARPADESPHSQSSDT